MYVDDPGEGLQQGDVVRDVWFSYLEQSNARLLMQNGDIQSTDLLDSSPLETVRR